MVNEGLVHITIPSISWLYHKFKDPEHCTIFKKSVPTGCKAQFVKICK